MLVYILKSTACLLAFMLCYKFVLEQQKMHQFNRFYLIGALFFSFGIPLVTFTKIVEIEQIPHQQMQEIFQFSPIPMETTAIVEPVNYLPLVLGIVYSIGLLIFLGVFIKNLIQLYTRISKNEKLRKEHSVQVLMQKNIIPHTFLKYIFLCKMALENKEIPAEVLLHEEAHVKQKHSLDILFVEFIKVIFWFNPLIYYIKHSIKLNHEFLADDAVLQKNVDASFYKKILLEFSLPNNQSEPILANSINYSSIKKRFKVMKKNTSKKSIWLRSLFLLPLIAILVYGFSNKETVEVVAQVNQAKKTEQVAPQNTEEGATEKMMQEYREYIQNYQNAKKKVVQMGEYNRIVAIYDLMSATQRATVIGHKTVIRSIPINLSTTKRKIPTETEYNSWKNADKFAIWIDGKHVPNSQLNKYSVTDFTHYNGSFVYNNARSDKFPQEYQYHLYTKQGFENTFLKAGFNKYSSLLKKYNAEKDAFLKSVKTDNSELRLKHSRLWKMYKKFTPQELKKYNPDTPEPYPYFKTEANSTQQKATSKEVAEYNSIVKKLMSRPEGRRIIKQKDVERIKYIYGLMTDEQKRNAEPFPKLAPPPPPPAMDTIYTYNSLAKRTKLIPNNRKNNLQHLKAMFNKMSILQKEKVESPSEIGKFIALLNNLSAEQNKKINDAYNKIKARARSKGRKFYTAEEYKELEELYATPMSIKVKKQEKSNIPPSQKPTNTQEKATPEQIATYNKLAKKYNAQPINDRVVKLKDLKRLEYVYGKMSLKQKENAQPFPECPPMPSSPVVQKGEKSNIPPPPPSKKVKIWERSYISPLSSASKPKNIAQNSEKYGYIQINNETHFYVSDKNGKTKYFNKWGVQVDKNGVSKSKEPSSDKKMRHVTINGVKRYYTAHKKDDKELIKSEKGDLKLTPEAVKEKLKKGSSGYIYTKDETYYFSKDKNEKITIYNKWGNVVDENDLDHNKIIEVGINSNKTNHQKKKMSKL